MPDGSNLPLIYSYLQTSGFFRDLDFDGKIGHWDHHFHETADIQGIIHSLRGILEEDRLDKRKRILGVRANIGDGKTTLLNFLKHKFPETFPIFLPAIQHVSEGSNDDLWRVLRMLVLQLFYEMRQRNRLEEKDYLEALTESNRARGGEDIQAAVCRFLRKHNRAFGGTYLMWLCDNISQPSCLACFRSLMTLQDLEPPYSRFFDAVPILLIFSTIDRGVESAWQTMIDTEEAGNLSRSLRVRHEDAFGIIAKILAGCAATTTPPVQPAFQQYQAASDSALYPFVKDDLTTFLEKKARKVLITDPRLDVKAEVVEIQLRNTLNLLQRAVDKMAAEGSARPVNLKDLESADSRP